VFGQFGVQGLLYQQLGQLLFANFEFLDRHCAYGTCGLAHAVDCPFTQNSAIPSATMFQAQETASLMCAGRSNISTQKLQQTSWLAHV
jgi:hypothetical protein